jgi:Phage capsid family
VLLPNGGVHRNRYHSPRLAADPVNARTQPTGILVHPEGGERWDQLKNTYEEYLLTDPRAEGGVPNLWGVPVAESDVFPVGNALVGDFRCAVASTARPSRSRSGRPDQDFIRNIVRLVAEKLHPVSRARPSGVGLAKIANWASPQMSTGSRSSRNPIGTIVFRGVGDATHREREIDAWCGDVWTG